MITAKASSPGTRAALGPRHRRRTQLRSLAYKAIRELGRRPTGHLPDYLEFAPSPRNDRDFSDLSARVKCYLGDLDIPLFVEGASGFTLNPATVPYMAPELVSDPGWRTTRPSGRPHLVVYRLTPSTLRRIATCGGSGATAVDGRLYVSSELTYWRLHDRLAWPGYPSAETSLTRLRESADGATSAYILATGPSALTVDCDAIDADVRITCNSAVRDLARLQAFRPTIIAFTDPVFHFGPSRYAAQFRRDLMVAVELCDPLLLCGSEWVEPLLHLLPELKGRLAVIPFGHGPKWRWPSDRDPTIRTTGSVLTSLMLPVALMLADHVSVAGVDGRRPSENYFWTHGLQYSDDLMRSVFDAHPAFFRDVDYAAHYDRYCREIEELIQAAEAQGKVVVGAAPSWIPAFQRRGALAPESSGAR